MALDISKVLELSMGAAELRTTQESGNLQCVPKCSELPEVVCQEGAPTPAGTSMFKCENFVYTHEV